MAQKRMAQERMRAQRRRFQQQFQAMFEQPQQKAPQPKGQPAAGGARWGGGVSAGMGVVLKPVPAANPCLVQAPPVQRSVRPCWCLSTRLLRLCDASLASRCT